MKVSDLHFYLKYHFWNVLLTHFVCANKQPYFSISARWCNIGRKWVKCYIYTIEICTKASFKTPISKNSYHLETLRCHTLVCSETHSSKDSYHIDPSQLIFICSSFSSVNFWKTEIGSASNVPPMKKLGSWF